MDTTNFICDENKIPCWTCNGDGIFNGETCYRCDGEGEVLEHGEEDEDENEFRR